MEQNILKTNVYTNETIISETIEQSVDTDFTLPDYCSDIERILKCKAVPRISLKSVSGTTITIDGNVSITIYYSDSEGKIASFCYSYPFEKVKDTDGQIDDAIINVNAKCEYINCRAVSSRKIDIHGAVGINICLKQRKSTEIISDISDKEIEILRGYSPATTPTGYAEKYLIIEEDTELSNDEGEKLFGYDANATVKETKIINGKLLVKGEMTVGIKYLSKGNIKCLNTDIPFSQVLEIETLGDTCESTAKAIVSFLEITPKINSSGNFGVCSINAKVLVCAETFCNNDIAVILDAYSKNKATEFSKNTICFCKLSKQINDAFSCKKNINIQLGGISSVLDNWCDIKITDSGFTEDSFIINGTVTSCFIITDSDGLASYFEKPIDFSYKCAIEGKTENLKCEPEIILSACSYTITGSDSVEVRVELSVKAPIYENLNMPVIVGLTEVEQTNMPRNDSAMIIYYASVGERLWDISKKYYASNEEIKSINGLSSEEISKETTILIPIK